MSSVKDFLKRKDIVITPQRYLIEALGAMAQGLFASLLIGTIIKTLGQQTGLETLVDLGGYATAMSGPAMAVAIGWALHCPPLVLFSLITVGYSANALGGAGGPLAVLIIAIVASELGKAVSKETRVDILVTPLVTIFSGVGLSMLIVVPLGIICFMSMFSGYNEKFQRTVTSTKALNDTAVEYINAGKLYGTVKQDGDAMGKANILMAINGALGKDWLDGTDYTMADDGYSIRIPYAKITAE